MEVVLPKVTADILKIKGEFFNTKWCTVEPAMISHSHGQPTSYGRPLGNSPKWHFVYKRTSCEQPPVLKGHISCVTRVAAIAGFTVYSNTNNHKQSMRKSPVLKQEHLQ